jgi:ribosomal protein S18 acetylase RimI-like enzyme
MGIGRALLRHAMMLINGRSPTLLGAGGGIAVYVLDGNTPALRLYRSEGFEAVDQFQSKNNGYPCTVLKLRYAI